MSSTMLSTSDTAQVGRMLPIFEIKTVDEGWEVSGYVSTFGNTDAGGDIVMPGAFEATLASSRKVKFLYAHRSDQVLGVPTSLGVDQKGLYGTFKISRTSLGQEVRTLLQDGALDSFSIGYVPTLSGFDSTGARLLKSVDLLECSIVALPMNDQAVVTSVKAAGRGRSNGALAVSPTPAAATSLGELVTSSAAYRSLLAKDVGSLPSVMGVELNVQLTDPIKALVTSATGNAGAVVPHDVGPLVPTVQRPVTLLDLIARTPTTSNLVEYVEQTLFTNAAATVPEATATTGVSGTKPESTATYVARQVNVRTIAHWIPVTTRMLADAPGIRGVIDAQLVAGLNVALETQVISGDGTGENLTGILTNPNINTQAKGADSAQDAILKGLGLVLTVGLSTPTAIVLNPTDFQTIRLARENTATGSLGGYSTGAPNLPGTPSLWGLPVVQSLGLPQGTALVGDFTHGALLFDRQEGSVTVGLQAQQFVRNMRTLVAELRAALGVLRPAAFTRITGL